LKLRNVQIGKIGIAIFLWIAVLLPWMEVDFSRGENALFIALVGGGLGLSELTLNASLEEYIISLLGILFCIGIICIGVYAFSEFRFGLTENYFLNLNQRIIFLAVGFLPIIIISGYFYYLLHNDNASHFTGIATGYWIYWVVIIASAFFEFRNSRLLRRPTGSSQ